MRKGRACAKSTDLLQTCFYCDRKAVRIMPDGTKLCDNGGCAIEYVEGHHIEYEPGSKRTTFSVISDGTAAGTQIHIDGLFVRLVQTVQFFVDANTASILCRLTRVKVDKNGEIVKDKDLKAVYEDIDVFVSDNLRKAQELFNSEYWDKPIKLIRKKEKK